MSVTYCKRCLYPSNHPLGLTFNVEGLCSGCIVHEEKDKIDWSKQEQKLAKILSHYRDPKGKRHDCIVPVSGARDSFFIVDLLRRKYGLNPLLVTFNRHYNTRAGIFNLERLRTHIGLDIISMTTNPQVVQRLITHSLKTLGSIHWPYLAGSTVFPVQMAVRKKIPLIIWGAHQGVDQVGMFSHHDEVEMTRRYRKEHDLMGVEAEELGEGSDFAPLYYPDDQALAEVGVRGIYLNNFIRWDTKAQHEAMLPRYDYYTGPQLRTFDTYNDIDCQVYSSLHDEIKFRKHGYGKITDHATREIRFGRLSREEGIRLVQHYTQKGDVNAASFAAWLGMGVDEFWAHVDAHRSSAIWEKTAKGWSLKDSVTNHAHDKGIDALRLPAKPDMNFRGNKPAALTGAPEEDALLMRGWAA